MASPGRSVRWTNELRARDRNGKSRQAVLEELVNKAFSAAETNPQQRQKLRKGKQHHTGRQGTGLAVEGPASTVLSPLQPLCPRHCARPTRPNSKQLSSQQTLSPWNNWRGLICRNPSEHERQSPSPRQSGDGGPTLDFLLFPGRRKNCQRALFSTLCTKAY